MVEQTSITQNSGGTWLKQRGRSRGIEKNGRSEEFAACGQSKSEHQMGQQRESETSQPLESLCVAGNLSAILPQCLHVARRALGLTLKSRINRC